MNALKIWISLLVFASVTCSAREYVRSDGSFKDKRDSQLVYFQLETFVKECTFVSSYDEKVVSGIQQIYDRLISEKKSKLIACYDENLPKMKSISYLYKKLCNSLSYDGIPVDNRKLLSQFVAVTEYKDGISLNHIILNDCLKKNSAAQSDFISRAQGVGSSTGLIKKLQRIDGKLPFFPNTVEIR